MRISRFIVALLVLSSGYLWAEPLPVADLKRNEPVSFATEIFPFLKANCLACHNSTKAKAGLILESPEDMIKGGDSGPALTAGNAQASLIFTTAAHLDDPVMPPPNNKSNAVNLAPAELALLRQWINEGAKGSRVAAAAPESWTFLEGIQPVHASAITNDGRFAAVSRGQRIDLYDLRMGKRAATLVDASLPFPGSHLDIVQSLAFSPDGTLASGGFREAKIWRRDVPKPSASPIELPADVTASSLFPDRRGLAFGLADGTLALLDLEKKDLRPVLIKDHSAPVRDLAVAPDASWVFSVSADKTLRGRSLAQINAVKTASLPAAGAALTLLAGGSHLLAATEDSQLHLFQTAGDFSKPVQSFKLLDSPLAGMRTFGDEVAIAYRNGSILVCQFNPSALDQPPTEVRRIQAGADLAIVAFGENRIATASQTGPAKLWNVADGKIVAEIAGNPDLNFRQEEAARLGSIAGRVRAYWNAKAPESEKLWKDESEKARKSGEAIAKAKLEAAAKTNDLNKAEANPSPKTEDLDKAREALKKAQLDLLSATRSREDSSRLAGEALQRHSLALSMVLEAETAAAELKTRAETLGKQMAEEAAKFSVAALRFSGDGDRLLILSSSGVMSVHDSTAGTWLENIEAPGASAIHASVDHWYLSNQKKDQIQPWTAGTAWELAQTLGDGKETQIFADRVSALAFSPDGKRLLAGGGVPSQNGEMVLFETAAWSVIKKNPKAHEDTVTSLAFSPDGTQFVSGASDRLVRIFQSETLEKTNTFEGHTSHVLDVDWNADGLTLVSSGADQEVKIWDIGNLKEKSKISGFGKEVSAALFLGGTETVLTASGDKTLKVANQPIPGAGQTFLHTAAASADGKIIIAGGEDGVLRVWDGVAKKPLKEFPPETAQMASNQRKNPAP